MSILKLEKSAWHPYFDRVSKLAGGSKRAEVEIAALNLGDQIEAQWSPLNGIVYDPKSDLIEVVLEGLDHLIYKPREVFVDQEAVILRSLEVIDENGVRHIIKLRDPLMLPSGARS